MTTTSKTRREQFEGTVPRYEEPGVNIVELFHVHPARPIGEQVRNTVLDLIARGIFREGMRIPSIGAIAQHLGVASGTIFRAMDDLAKKKVIVGKWRSGFVVGQRPALYAAAGIPALSNAIFACRRLGMNATDIESAYKEALKEHMSFMQRENVNPSSMKTVTKAAKVTNVKKSSVRKTARKKRR